MIDRTDGRREIVSDPPAPRQRPTLADRKRTGVPSVNGRFLRLNDMIASTGLSESTIRRRVKEGAMPPPVALTERCVGWWEQVFTAWAAQQMERSASS